MGYTEDNGCDRVEELDEKGRRVSKTNPNLKFGANLADHTDVAYTESVGVQGLRPVGSRATHICRTGSICAHSEDVANTVSQRHKAKHKDKMQKCLAIIQRYVRVGLER